MIMRREDHSICMVRVYYIRVLLRFLAALDKFPVGVEGELKSRWASDRNVIQRHSILARHQTEHETHHAGGNLYPTRGFVDRGEAGEVALDECGVHGRVRERASGLVKAKYSRSLCKLELDVKGGEVPIGITGYEWHVLWAGNHVFFVEGIYLTEVETRVKGSIPRILLEDVGSDPGGLAYLCAEY